MVLEQSSVPLKESARLQLPHEDFGSKTMSTHHTVAVIPARMASTRFPGKPLVPILGLPMIEHVRRRVALTRSISRVVVATCDREILDVVSASGGIAVLTSPAHERCTDRVAEAAANTRADMIVNVQGDEPCVWPEMLEALLEPLIADPTLVCTNLMAPITREVDFQSSNVVKVVVNLRGDALYFSREPIPSGKKASDPGFLKYKQLGIVAFRADFLQTFTRLSPTPLEIIESVDMMRAIEHGYTVRMVPCDRPVVGVDRAEDVARAIELLRDDPLVPQYRR